MNQTVALTYHRRPSAIRSMVHALVPKPHRRETLDVPPIRATWRGLVPGEVVPSGVCQDGGGHLASDPVPPIHLHAASMRLMMAILTHPRFPVPIWHVLQVRNRIAEHRTCRPSDRLEATATVAAWRILAKGAEFDLGVEISARDGRVLESVSTFYARGSFGPEGSGAPGPSAPEPPATVCAAWSIERRGAWGFARLTGDYNGLHWAHPYARALGFASAFSHPHRALAQILSRLPQPAPGAPLGLEAWFKGPVYYGKPLRLAWTREGSEIVFALRLQDDPRPAILGRLHSPSEVPTSPLAASPPL